MKSLTDQFADWVATKPRDEAYDYGDIGNCAFSQFLRDRGFAREPSCSNRGWHDMAKGETYLDARPLPFDDRLLLQGDWTFGALSDRLSSLARKGDTV